MAASAMTNSCGGRRGVVPGILGSTGISSSEQLGLLLV